MVSEADHFYPLPAFYYGFVKNSSAFDRPFDKLTVLSKVEGLMALNKAEG